MRSSLTTKYTRINTVDGVDLKELHVINSSINVGNRMELAALAGTSALIATVNALRRN